MCNEIYITIASYLKALLQIHLLDIRRLLLDLNLEEFVMHEFLLFIAESQRSP